MEIGRGQPILVQSLESKGQTVVGRENNADLEFNPGIPSLHKRVQRKLLGWKAAYIGHQHLDGKLLVSVLQKPMSNNIGEQ
jgi:hypothetical protein